MGAIMFKSTIPGSSHKTAHLTSQWLHEIDVIIPFYRWGPEAQKVNQKENGIKMMTKIWAWIFSPKFSVSFLGINASALKFSRF